MANTYEYVYSEGALLFDFDSEIISCSPETTTIDIQDLINGCRQAEYSQKGIAYGVVANASGKDYLDTNNGVQVGITIVLLGSWRVYTEKTTGVFRVVGGNLVQVSGGDPFEPNPLVTYVNIQSAASTIVQVSTGSGLSTEEHNQLMAIATKTELTEEVEGVKDSVATRASQTSLDNVAVTVSGTATPSQVETIIDDALSDFTPGTGGTTTISPDFIRTSLGMSQANLDIQLRDINTNITESSQNVIDSQNFPPEIDGVTAKDALDLLSAILLGNTVVDPNNGTVTHFDNDGNIVSVYKFNKLMSRRRIS